MEEHVDEKGAKVLMEREPLTPGEIASFLDGKLEGEELARLQARFAADPVARQELIKASRILASASSKPQPTRSWIPAFAMLAAAAAIAIVFVPARYAGRDVPVVPVERRARADELPRMQVVTPAKGSSIHNDKRPFTWRAVDGATYSVVISDVSGNTVLQKNTADTVLAIPETLLDRDPGTYYIEVDALLPDGSSVGSGAQEFVVTHW